jgi:hypothetical protein
MPCQNKKRANCHGGRSTVRPARACRGGGWFWLILVLALVFPWGWACENRASSTASRGAKFRLEMKTREAQEALAQARKNLEEMKQSGRLSAGKFDAEMRKLEEVMGDPAADGRGDELDALVNVTGEKPAAGATTTPARPSRRPPPAARRDAPPGADIPHWTIELDLGESKDDPERAKAAVLDKACEAIAQWIRDTRNPDLSLSRFKPDEAYLRKWSIIGGGPEAVQRNLGDSSDPIWGAQIEVVLMPAAQGELREAGRRSQEDFRLEAAWERQLAGIKALTALAAALGALLAFFHLDDRTRGYYSKPLGAALIAVAVAFGVMILKA